MQKEDLIIKIDGEITKLRLFRKVVISGNGGAVTIPKELVGKIIEIKYDKENKK